MLSSLTSALQPVQSAPSTAPSDAPEATEPQPSEPEATEPDAVTAERSLEPRQHDMSVEHSTEPPAPKQGLALVLGSEDFGLAQARQYALAAQKAQALDLMIERISAPVAAPSLLEPYEAVPEALSVGATDVEAAVQQGGQRVDLRV